MRKGHAAIPCTDTQRNEQTRTKAGTQCRKSSDEQRFSIPRSHLHQWLAHLKKKRKKNTEHPQAPSKARGKRPRTHSHNRYKASVSTAQPQAAAPCAGATGPSSCQCSPTCPVVREPTQGTYVRLRNHVESRSGNRDTPEKQQRRVLRGPAEALVHRVVLR